MNRGRSKVAALFAAREAERIGTPMQAEASRSARKMRGDYALRAVDVIKEPGRD